jgi:hypothetical protein
VISLDQACEPGNAAVEDRILAYRSDDEGAVVS